VTVFGLDLSLARTGLARPDGTTVSIRATADSKDPLRRLNQFADAIGRELRRWPDAALAVVEGPNLHGPSSGTTRIRLGELRGVVILLLWERGLDVVDVPPSSLKLAATGNGNADKDAMVAAAEAAGATPGNHDEADAWHLHRTGLRALAGDPTLPPSVAALPWPTPTRRTPA
jgi:Holliday junction resolvasome RuvABC endonuclease subunit